MLKLLKTTFLICLFPQMVFANVALLKNSDTQYLLSNIKEASHSEAKFAKYLEDFYWAFRNQNKTWLKRSHQNFNPKNEELAVYKKVLSEGLNLSNSISSNDKLNCDSISRGFDTISKKYYSLYRKVCFQEKISNILNSKKSLKESDKSFLLGHENILTSNRYKSLLISKIKKSSNQDKTFFSNYIKQYIYTQKSLPNIEFMELISVDAKVTQFIQKNGLFDKHDSKFFTNEFKRLISDFRSSFLDGDQETASALLQKAVDFYDNNENKIDNAKAWKLFFYNGKTLAREQESQDLALSLFKFSEKMAEEENLFDSKFQSLLTYYQSNQLSKAISFIEDNRFVDEFSTLTPQIRFWTAYIYDQKNEKVMAKELYLKQISLSPLNYYSILSLKQLRNINSNYTSDIIVKPDTLENINFVKLTKDGAQKIKLFKIFTKANSTFLSSLQGKELRYSSSKKFFAAVDKNQKLPNKKNFLLSFFSQEGQYLLSFKQAYTALRKGDIDLTPTVISSLFPQIYDGIIKSQNSPIDHRLILSLIRQESAFNKKAKSVVGARGLMQLMPSTARMFKRRLKTHQLFDPNLNIKIGVKFLERLVKRYDGNLMFTLSAYNAGMGNVGKWMKTIPFGDDILLNVELIPFSETKKYVKLIYRNLFFYKYLDQDPAHLDLALRESFNVTFNN